MLEEFARCYQAKTGDNFDVKCRQIRYVLVVEHVVATVLNLQTHPFIQVSCVVCVTHASLMRAVMCGDQVFVGMGDAL
jgi:hypothetical protein